MQGRAAYAAEAISEPKAPQETEWKLSGRASKLLAFLRAHPGTMLSIAELALELGVSAATICRAQRELGEQRLLMSEVRWQKTGRVRARLSSRRFALAGAAGSGSAPPMSHACDNPIAPVTQLKSSLHPDLSSQIPSATSSEIESVDLPPQIPDEDPFAEADPHAWRAEVTAAAEEPSAALAIRPEDPIEPDALLLRRLEREHGPQSAAMVHAALARPEARQHPAAARQALEALGTFRRSEVRRSVGALLVWLVREAIAGRQQLGSLVEEPAVARITRAIDDCEQTQRWDEATKLRRLQHQLGRRAAAEREHEQLQDPRHQRVQAMIDATLQGRVSLPLGHAPQPRELQPRAPIKDRYLARALARALPADAS